MNSVLMIEDCITSHTFWMIVIPSDDLSEQVGAWLLGALKDVIISHKDAETSPCLHLKAIRLTDEQVSELATVSLDHEIESLINASKQSSPPGSSEPMA